MWIPILILLGVAPLIYYLGKLYFGQDKLIFRPGKQLKRSPADYSIPYETVHLQPSKGIHVSSWWIPHPKSKQTVIFFHGSDGNIAYELPTIHFLHQLQLNALIVEYPGYEQNGQKPSESGCYLTADAAWDFVTNQQGIDPETVILFGQSLGSAVATYLAEKTACYGLVLQSGFTSVPNLAELAYPYLPVRWFCHTKMDSLARINNIQCPVLILHSESDEAIPISQARQLYDQATGPKKMVTFHGPHFGNHWLRVPEVHKAWKQLLSRDLETWQSA